jgi:hypothetical protein
MTVPAFKVLHSKVWASGVCGSALKNWAERLNFCLDQISAVRWSPQSRSIEQISLKRFLHEHGSKSFSWRIMSANGIRNPWQAFLLTLPTMWVSGFIFAGAGKAATNIVPSICSSLSSASIFGSDDQPFLCTLESGKPRSWYYISYLVRSSRTVSAL